MQLGTTGLIGETGLGPSAPKLHQRHIRKGRNPLYTCYMVKECVKNTVSIALGKDLGLLLEVGSLKAALK